jgi:glycosyltransferase involved in cell wall biosynthesis
MPAVFFAKLTGKVSIINIGGYDADEILQSSPHNLKEKFRKFCVVYSIKNSTRLLPVSDVIRGYLEKVVPADKCTTAYCCIDENKFSAPGGIPPKENLVITVGGGGEFIKEAKRKRLDFFIELGEEFNKQYPEYNSRFYAIGHNENTNTYKYLSKLIKSKNVELKPNTLTIEELTEYYKKASVYMQLSFYEAFGIAQAEAMLFGCIPVSNPGGAIPEVIGDAGFTIENYNLPQYITKIREIFDGAHEALRKKARERVMNNFLLSTRKVKLLKIIDSLLS